MGWIHRQVNIPPCGQSGIGQKGIIISLMKYSGKVSALAFFTKWEMLLLNLFLALSSFYYYIVTSSFYGICLEGDMVFHFWAFLYYLL